MTKARSNATANAAKGDLTVGNGTNLSGVLAVGSNGDTIVADSSTATGLRYQGSMAAGRNFVTNGGMDIWQRGTSALDGQNTYKTADRWLLSSATAVTFSRQATGDTTNLPFIQYCMRVQRTSGSTSTSSGNISQSFETVNSIPLAGKTVTLSFYARAGANYSASSSVLRAQVTSGTGTDQNVYTAGYTGAVTFIDQNATLTTTWQRFTYTAAVASNATEIGINFLGAYTGTAGAADYYEVTGIQLEVGSVATQFTRQGGTIQGELAACQRYYWRETPGTPGSRYTATLGATSGTDSYGTINNPVPMRTTPTSVDYSALNVVNAGTSTFAVTSITLNASLGTKNNSGVSVFVASGLTTGQWHCIQTSTSSGYIGFSAEL